VPRYGALPNEFNRTNVLLQQNGKSYYYQLGEFTRTGQNSLLGTSYYVARVARSDGGLFDPRYPIEVTDGRTNFGTVPAMSGASFFPNNPPGGLNGLWYEPQKTGWGVTISEQGNKLFAAIYLQGNDGKPLWLVMPDIAYSNDKIHRGRVYLAQQGTPFDKITSGVAAPKMQDFGVGSIEAALDGDAVLSLNLNGNQNINARLKRFVFGKLPSCEYVASNTDRQKTTIVSDLWWDSSTPGWGVSLEHQGDKVFAAWYTYGADGKATWVTASDLSKTPEGTFTGKLYRQEQVSAGVSLTKPVGTLTLSYANGDLGVFAYTLDGITQSKIIRRYIFGDKVMSCKP
jgi:hypothetical protein